MSSRQKQDSKDDSAQALTPGKKTPTNGEVLMRGLLKHVSGLKVSTVISEKTDSPPSPPPGSQPEHSEPTPGNQTAGLHSKRPQKNQVYNENQRKDAQTQAQVQREWEKAQKRKAHAQKLAQDQVRKESNKCRKAQELARAQNEQKKAHRREVQAQKRAQEEAQRVQAQKESKKAQRIQARKEREQAQEQKWEEEWRQAQELQAQERVELQKRRAQESLSMYQIYLDILAKNAATPPGSEDKTERNPSPPPCPVCPLELPHECLPVGSYTNSPCPYCAQKLPHVCKFTRPNVEWHSVNHSTWRIPPEMYTIDE